MRKHTVLRTLAVLIGLAAAAASAAGQVGPQGPGRPRAQAGPGPGMFGPALFPNPNPMDPVLGKLTMRIMALREIHGAGFTAKDVAAATPILKEMRDSEKALQTKTEGVLEQEVKALLAAGAEDDPPKSSGPAMEEASKAHQQKMGRAWERLTEAIGERKVGCLQRLLGMGGPMPMMPFGMPGGPGMQVPGGGRGVRPGMPGGGPGMPGGGPGGPGGPPTEPFGQDDGMGPAPEQDPAFIGGEAQIGPSPGQGPAGPPAMQRGRRAGQGPGGPQGGQPGMFPGQGPGFVMGNLPMMQPIGPRLTLSELAELMEQKLAAMRK